MTDPSWFGLFEECSNTGRWGHDDERGTLNYIGPEEVLRALHTVKDGELVSLAYDLPIADRPSSRQAASLRITHDGPASEEVTDVVTIAAHGFDVTHLDAVGHVYFAGRAYNGRRVGDIVTDEGLTYGAITGAGGGICTRGVLLDIAAVRGVDALGYGDGVTLADIRQAEQLSGTEVRQGDAIFLRTGIGLDRRWMNPETVAGRPGILPEVIPWLHERRVAVYSGDCIERLSEAGVGGEMPLHRIGLAAMGLALLDNPDVETLRRAVRRYGRSQFLVFIAPLRIRGGTGSAVNPIAVF